MKGRRSSSRADRVRSWVADRERLAFLAVLLLHLVPLWAFTYFPSQDGPNHLDNASVIRAYGRPDGAALRRYYVLDDEDETNWLGHLILAGLLSVVPIHVAQRLFLTGYVLLLPLSLRYALRAIGPEACPMVFLVFPFVYNYPLHMGFYNFEYGLALSCLLVGYFLRARERFGWRQMAALGLLSLLLYLFHVASWAMAVVALAVLAGWQTARPARGKAAGYGRVRLGWIPAGLTGSTRLLLAVAGAETPIVGAAGSLPEGPTPPESARLGLRWRRGKGHS